MVLYVIALICTFALQICTIASHCAGVGDDVVIAEKASAYDSFLKATYEQSRSDLTSAQKSYEEILKGKHPIYVYEGYLQLLFDAEQHEKLTKIYLAKERELQKLLKKNQQLHLVVAQSLMATNHDKRAEALFQSLLKKHKNDAEICYYSAVAYLKNNKLARGIQFLEECCKNDNLSGKRYLFNFLLSKAYLSKGNNSQALTCIEKSLKQFPKFDRGWLFKAILLEQEGNIKEAINGYQQFLNIAGSDNAVEKQLIQLLFAEQRFTEAADMLKKMNSNSGEYFFDLALINAQANKLDEALGYINCAVEKMPQFERATLLKIEILARLNRHEELMNFVKEWILREPGNLGALHTCLLLKNSAVPITNMTSLFEEILKLHPQPFLIHALLGDLYLELNNQEKALAHYRKASQRCNEETLRGKIAFQICYVLYKAQQYRQLDAELEKTAASGIVYHGLQNLHAYYLAQQEIKLDDALMIINQALETKPDNPGYLDTKGLILAKLGKKKEAYAVLNRALQLSPQDPTIIRHLREVSDHGTHTKRNKA